MWTCVRSEVKSIGSHSLRRKRQMTSGMLEEASGKVHRMGFCEEETDVFNDTSYVCLSGKYPYLCVRPAGH